MKWEHYKLLSKEEKEEYNFKFSKDYHEPIFGAAYYFGLIAFTLIFAGLLVIMAKQGIATHEIGIAILQPIKFVVWLLITGDVSWLITSHVIESIWIKKHLKVTHK